MFYKNLLCTKLKRKSLNIGKNNYWLLNDKKAQNVWYKDLVYGKPLGYRLILQGYNLMFCQGQKDKTAIHRTLLIVSLGVFESAGS